MAILNIAQYVRCSELLEPAHATVPQLSKLCNNGGLKFELKECASDEVYTKCTELRAFEFEDCTQAGHVFFHPETRASPPIPPAAALQAFVDANPELPVVIESDRVVENPHLVITRFITKGQINIDTGEVEVAVDEDDRAIIQLFTVAADNCGRYFNPSTHLKNGKHHSGVQIFDWSMVTFNANVGLSPSSAWLALYKRLHWWL